MTQQQERVAVIGTGGTISSVGRDGLDIVRYVDTGKIYEVDELLNAFPETLEQADVVPVRLRAMPSTAIGPAEWLEIAAKIHELAESDPDILRWLTDILSFKLRWLSILFQIHGTESVRQRLAKLLLMLAEIYGEPDGAGVVIKHQISQSNLATLAGASRQWTNRTLGELKDDGLLEIANRRIRILDLERLGAISSEEARLFN